MRKGGSGDAQVVLGPLLKAGQDVLAVRLRLDEGGVVLDVLDEPVGVPCFGLFFCERYLAASLLSRHTTHHICIVGFGLSKVRVMITSS